MRDPLDVLARYFWPIIGCWGALVAIALAWIALRVLLGILARRRVAQDHSSR